MTDVQRRLDRHRVLSQYERHDSWTFEHLDPTTGEVVVPCYYCGRVHECIEHVVPVAVVAAASSSDLRRWRAGGLMVTVPACNECNYIAAAHFDQTLEARRARVVSGIKKRHRKVYKLPEWSDSDLAQIDLSSTLGRGLLAKLAQKSKLTERLQWAEGTAI
jgi:hypothetical protein